MALSSANQVCKIAPNGTITIVAGNGSYGFGGDGAAATAAQLRTPGGVAVDGSGNLFIVDQGNNRIRKVNTSGVISTVAGNGNFAFGGDGAAATAAQLATPSGVAVDSSGNLFIADKGNNRIRKVNPGGVISTVAGTGSYSFGGDGAAATAAQLKIPIGVAVDSNGNLFVADLGNNRIRKVNSGGVITTVAGNGNFGFGGDGAAATAAQLYNPFGVAVDSSGNLFIADYGNHRIRKVDPGGIISTVAGNGSVGFGGDGAAATAAQLSFPSGVAVDSSGNLFIADYGNNRIRKVDTSGIIKTVAGNGSGGFGGDGLAATAAQLYHPSGVAVDNSGNLFIADLYNHRVRKLDTGGVITTVAGNGNFGFGGDGAAATAAQLFYPISVAVDSSGNLFIADQSNQRIRKVDTSGLISTVGGNGGSGFGGDGAAATAAQLYNPRGVAVDSSGNLFIGDYGNNRIRKVDPGGVISTVAGNGNFGFGGDGAAATAAQLSIPSGVTLDSSGNLFIADYGNHRIRKVDAPDIAPLAPTQVVATAGDGQALLSWTAPTSNGGSAVLGYTVSSQPPGASCPVTINTGSPQQTCTATGLTNGTSYTFSVVATNAVGDGPAATSNAVVPTAPVAALSLTGPVTPANAQVGEAYQLQLVASGGAGGYTYALAGSSGALPAGLSLNASTGLVSGTPDAAASVLLNFQVTDIAHASATWSVTLTTVPTDVRVPPANQTLPAAVMGTAYNASIVATGGTGGYGYRVTAGQLPAGLNLNPDTGAITGIPTQVETQTFGVTIVDSTLKSARLKAGGTTVHSTTQAFSITVAAAPVVPMAPAPVPSLALWGVIALNLMTAVLGALAWRWRKRPSPLA
ncbi:MAG: putative Ig domain-containing protein [Burkholderiaceae bacterium]|nr:putative Ig domain-containing protein [Burkholderiaceae bacterium]